MNDYYTIESNAWDKTSEIRLGPIPYTIDIRSYLWDEWQYLNDEKEFIAFEMLGKDMPDIYTYDIPLISASFKEILDAAGVTNVFYKPIFLHDKGNNVEEYYLMLVEALDCVIWEKSEHTVSAVSDRKKITGSFTIDTNQIGNYKIFKIKNLYNTFWIINDELKNLIEEANLKGIKLLKPSEYYGI